MDFTNHLANFTRKSVKIINKFNQFRSFPVGFFKIIIIIIIVILIIIIIIIIIIINDTSSIPSVFHISAPYNRLESVYMQRMLQCNGSGSNGSVTDVRKYCKSLLVLISQCRMLTSTVLHPNCFRLFIKNTRFCLGQKLIWKDSHQYPNIRTPLSLYSPSVFFMFNYHVYRN